MPAGNGDSSEQFYGHVEVCSSERIAGWVWNPEKPSEKEIIDISVHDRVVTSIVANEYREDLKIAGIGDGTFGFSASPFGYAAESTVQVVARNSGIRLTISDPFFGKNSREQAASTVDSKSEAPDQLQAMAVGEGEGQITPPAAAQSDAAILLAKSVTPRISLRVTEQFVLIGAVSARSGDTRVPKIALFVDGQPFAETFADKHVASELLAESEHQVGFLFQLPDSPPTSFLRKLRVVCGDAESALEVDYRKRYVGYFERYEFADKKLRVAGWVHDKALEFTPISIDASYEGKYFTSILANKMRPDLQKARIGMGNHSFDTIVSLDIEKLDPARLEIIFTGTQIAVPRNRLAKFDTTASILSRASGQKRETADPEKVRGFLLTDGDTSKAHGYVDVMTSTEIRGWAYDSEHPDQPVALDFLIDGQLVASARTDRFRADLAQKFGSSGYHGFNFEVLPQYAQIGWRIFTVSIRRGIALDNGTQKIQMMPAHVALVARPPRTVVRARQRPGSSEIVMFSLIVLNLNGAGLLREFFRTLERYEKNLSFEVLIIDHGSTDDSASVCNAYAYLNVRFFARGRNFSFSESNNYGARLAKGEILICLNNDIFWCQPVLDEVAAAFTNSEVGCVGIQLLDTPLGNLELAPPIVQTIGIRFNFHLRDRAIHPVETRFDSSVADAYFDHSDAPAVTGAFLCMRAKEFSAVGGFDEGYNYGYEDVDLCLKVVLDLGRRIECRNGVRAFHHRGYSRKKSDKWSGSNMLRNRQRLEENFAYRVRRDVLGALFDRAQFWQGRPLVIAFAVTEASNTTAAGDFFTAAEFGEALQEGLGASIIFLEEKKNWYDVLGVDILIIMRHEYQLDRLVNKKSTLVTVGWARNWFEKWVEVPSARDYNLLAASGDQAVAYMTEKLRRPVFKLNIATNASRFTPDDDAPKPYDVIFSGNFWGHPREIAYMFRPEIFSGTFKAFGAGWELVHNWAPYWQGLKAYGELPDIYKQTKIVLDDANSVTKEWGSVNSRVYDAIAAGCLVVTNGRRGANAEFNGLLPSYESTHELHDTLNKYLNDPTLFDRTRHELRALVLEKHTYNHRVGEFVDHVTSGLQVQRRFSIKIGAPSKAVAAEWGDTHFAEALKDALLELGHVARIDCLDAWEGPAGYVDDCVIVLRGLSIYKTKPYQCNVLWIISHPDLISVAECESYDLVFTASEKHKTYLNAQGVAAETLLQCTDHHRFVVNTESSQQENRKPIFVGNTRNVYRPIVKHAIESGLDFNVIGAGWRDFIPASYVAANYAPNEELPDLYRSATFVLNDHWQSMRSWGFVSNRVFDVIACGSPCLSDHVEGIEELFGSAVVTYEGNADFAEAIKLASQLRGDEALLAEASVRVLSEHTFLCRARRIVERFSAWEQILSRKRYLTDQTCETKQSAP